MQPNLIVKVCSVIGGVSSVYDNPVFNFVLNAGLDVSRESNQQVVAHRRCVNFLDEAINDTFKVARCTSDVCKNAPLATKAEFK